MIAYRVVFFKENYKEILFFVVFEFTASVGLEVYKQLTISIV